MLFISNLYSYAFNKLFYTHKCSEYLEGIFTGAVGVRQGNLLMVPMQALIQKINVQKH